LVKGTGKGLGVVLYGSGLAIRWWPSSGWGFRGRASRHETLQAIHFIFTQIPRQPHNQFSMYIGTQHRRTARGGHGLLKVSLGPAMPNPSMPSRQAKARRAAFGRLLTPLDTPRCTPMEKPKNCSQLCLRARKRLCEAGIVIPPYLSQHEDLR
jgi:hypothetical protein